MIWFITMSELFEYALSPYTNLLGWLFLPLLFFGILGAIWIRTKSVVIVAIITMVALPFITYGMTKQVHVFIYLLLAFTIAGVIYLSLKGRGY